MPVLSAFLFFHGYDSTIDFKFHPPGFSIFDNTVAMLS